MNKRIEWIDIAKGISIILVVLGHTSFTGPIALWLKSFRMPFFFFVSGILFKNSKYPHIKDFLDRRTSTIIRPYIIFSLIVFIWDKLIGDPDSFTYVQLLTGWVSYALWFIPVLMMTQILYYYICKLCNDKTVYILASLIAFAITGYFLYKYNVHFYYKIETVCTTVFFYGISNLNKSKLVSFMEKERNARLIIILLSSFIVSFVSSIFNTRSLDLCFNIIGDPFFSYTAAVFGTLFMLCFSKLITTINLSLLVKLRDLISYIGKNSYVVLAFHQIIGGTLILFFSHFGLPSSLSSILRHTIMWSLLLLMIYLINRYVPWLLGKNKLENTSKVVQSSKISDPQ